MLLRPLVLREAFESSSSSRADPRSHNNLSDNGRQVGLRLGALIEANLGVICSEGSLFSGLSRLLLARGTYNIL